MILRWAFQKPKDQSYDYEEYMRETLKKLLVARHVGSPGHEAVRDFLDKELMRLGYMSKRDDFFQGINFSNVIGLRNDQAQQYVMLTCHYDGPSPRKGQEKDLLVSATDGAVSCAILLTLAKMLNDMVKSLGPRCGLALVFFDGHESLATEPVNKPLLYGSENFVNTEYTLIENVALVVTLNLIGAPNQTFPSYSEIEDKNRQRLADIELELRKSGQLVDCHVLFQIMTSYGKDLPDDHVPFKKKGMPVLHISPENYPNVHHTAADKAENLHWPTIFNMIKILCKFIYDDLVDFDQYDDIDFEDD
ncbi:hypothetical protein KR038_005308, partial [Drosophila bunnanda]